MKVLWGILLVVLVMMCTNDGNAINKVSSLQKISPSIRAQIDFTTQMINPNGDIVFDVVTDKGRRFTAKLAYASIKKEASGFLLPVAWFMSKFSEDTYFYVREIFCGDNDIRTCEVNYEENGGITTDLAYNMILSGAAVTDVYCEQEDLINYDPCSQLIAAQLVAKRKRVGVWSMELVEVTTNKIFN